MNRELGATHLKALISQVEEECFSKVLPKVIHVFDNLMEEIASLVGGPDGRDSQPGWRSVQPQHWSQLSSLLYQAQDHPWLHLHLSGGLSPISLTTQEAWSVAAVIIENINTYFEGGQHTCCVVKITGDLTMFFPANHNVPVLSL